MPRYRNTEVLKQVGRSIRVARTLRGWSQEVLAERLGVEPVTISRFETGARGPDLAMLLQLARLLEVPPAALLEGLDVHPQLAREPEDTTYEVLQVWSRIPASFHAVALDVLRAFIR